MRQLYFILLFLFIGILSNLYSGDFILSISPDSKKVFLLNRDIPGVDIVLVRNIEDEKIIMRKRLKCDLKEGDWLDNEKILVVTNDYKYNVIDINKNTENEIKTLKGIMPSALSIESRIGVIVIGAFANEEKTGYESIVYIYDYKNDNIRKIPCKKPFDWLFDIKYYDNNTLYINLESTLAKFSLDTGKISTIFDSKGDKINILESPINISKNKKYLLFETMENEISKIALFDLSTKKLKIIKNLVGFSLPLLAPNNKFLIVTYSTPPFKELKIDICSGSDLMEQLY